MRAEKRCFPVAITSAEESEAKHSTSSGMGDGVDLVKLNGNHLGPEAFVGVVDYTSTLDNIHCGIGKESFGSPSWVMWVGAVVAVKDANDFRIRPQTEEVVEIVGFRLGTRHLDDSQVLVLARKLGQLTFERFYRLGCVVDEIDPQFVRGVNQLLACIQDLMPNDFLFVRQICYNNQVDRRQVFGSAVDVTRKVAAGFNGHCGLARIANRGQAEEGLDYAACCNVEVG